MSNTPKMKAPYVSKAYMKKFLQQVKVVKFPKINASILRQYGIASPGNESKMMAALRYLNILNQDNSINEDNYGKIRLQGEQYQLALKDMVKNAYADIFDNVNLMKATETHLTNHFISKYDFSALPARLATVLFVFLCAESGIDISDELKELNKRKSSISRKRQKKAVVKEEQTVQIPNVDDATLSMHELSNSAVDSTKSEGYNVLIKGKDLSLNIFVRTRKDAQKVKNALDTFCELVEE